RGVHPGFAGTTATRAGPEDHQDPGKIEAREEDRERVMTTPLANAALIKVARQARGMSQLQLAKAAGVTQAAISKSEAGLTQPGPELIESLAKALTFPASLFYETDPVFGVPVSINYRKSASVGAKA